MVLKEKCTVSLRHATTDVVLLVSDLCFVLYSDIIACNVQNDNGKCIMVDYDGTNVKGTMSKTIVGQTQTLTMGSPTGIPEALNKWAANVLVLDVSTVTAAPVARRQ